MCFSFLYVKNCRISILVCLVLVCIVGIGLIQFVNMSIKAQKSNPRVIIKYCFEQQTAWNDSIPEIGHSPPSLLELLLQPLLGQFVQFAYFVDAGEIHFALQGALCAGVHHLQFDLDSGNLNRFNPALDLMFINEMLT